MQVQLPAVVGRLARPLGPACLATIASLAARFAIDPWVGDGLPYLTFFPAVAFAGYFGGLSSGLITAVLGAILADFFFVPPRHTFLLAGPGEWIGLAGYVLGSAAICLLIRSRTQAWRKAEDAAVTRLRFAGIVDSAMDAIIVVDESQHVQAFNRAAEQIFGCPAFGALGQPLDKFIPERFRHAHRQHVQDFGHTGVTNRSMYRPGTLWGLRSDGEEFPIEATISQVEAGGEKLFTVILRDVTERKKTEEALRNAEKMVATGQMAATLAHEINNPLAAAVNLAYIVRSRRRLPEELQHQAEMLDEELKRISHIVRQTLGLYREDVRSLPEVRLQDIVDEVLETHRERLNGLSIERRYDAKGPVRANRGELHQLVTNLIVNAVEAVPDCQGSIRVHVFASRDWRRPDRPGIRIVVADSGIGMDRETRRRISEPFFTTKHQKGTGLGLSVVHWIAAKYNGSLHIYSSTRPGRSGTCVSVFLSAEPTDKRAAEPAKPELAVYRRSQAS